MLVYLCGPINGCTDAECNDWRSYAKSRLSDTLDPMRRDYRGREAESVNEIVELDKIDVQECDVVIANCPKPSVGTSMEVFYAWELGKKIAAIAPEPVSPWLRYHSTRVFGTIKEAIDWIEALA
jgi:nucleoside 2-deoxyribosyltransferase